MPKHLLFLNAMYPAKRRMFEAARRLGLTISVVGPELPEWVRGYVDCYICAQTRDPAQLGAALQALHRRHDELPFDGVVTFWDHGVVAAAHVAEEFELPGCTAAAAERARNKHRMRTALAEHAVPQPRFARVTSAAELAAAGAELGYPLIFKPTGAAGSAGVLVLNGPGETAAAFETARTFFTPDADDLFGYYPAEFIAEEFMPGPEVSAECVVTRGQVQVVAITDKWTTDESFIEYQHAVPSKLAAIDAERVRQVACAAIRAVGIGTGGVHAEVKLTPDGPKVVEVNARLAGDYIASHLVPLACGVDLVTATIKAALGEPPDPAPARGRGDAEEAGGAAIRFLLANRAGIIRSWAGVERARRQEGVAEVGVTRPVGENIRLPPHNFFELRLGHVITQAADPATAVARARRAAELISVGIA